MHARQEAAILEYADKANIDRQQVEEFLKDMKL
jgi:hypothetical protein